MSIFYEIEFAKYILPYRDSDDAEKNGFVLSSKELDKEFICHENINIKKAVFILNFIFLNIGIDWVSKH